MGKEKIERDQTANDDSRYMASGFYYTSEYLVPYLNYHAASIRHSPKAPPLHDIHRQHRAAIMHKIRSLDYFLGGIDDSNA